MMDMGARDMACLPSKLYELYK